MVKRGDLNVPIIGVALPKWSLERLHKRVTDSIKRSGGIDNKRAFRQLLSLFKYVSGDYNDPHTFTRLDQFRWPEPETHAISSRLRHAPAGVFRLSD